MTDTLPQDMRSRPPIVEDLEAVATLMNACAIAEYGMPDYTTDDLRNEWSRPGFDLGTDARIVTLLSGQIVSYMNIWPGPTLILSEAFVHPQQRGQRIGTYLLGPIEARDLRVAANVPAGAQVILRQELSSSNLAARHLLEQLLSG